MLDKTGTPDRDSNILSALLTCIICYDEVQCSWEQQVGKWIESLQFWQDHPQNLTDC